jgi:hypothetical protein
LLVSVLSGTPNLTKCSELMGNALTDIKNS